MEATYNAETNKVELTDMRTVSYNKITLLARLENINRQLEKLNTEKTILMSHLNLFPKEQKGLNYNYI